MSSRTHSVSLDFEALSHYGINSNQKGNNKGHEKWGNLRPKALVDSFDKEGIWVIGVILTVKNIFQISVPNASCRMKQKSKWRLRCLRTKI